MINPSFKDGVRYGVIILLIIQNKKLLEGKEELFLINPGQQA